MKHATTFFSPSLKYVTFYHVVQNSYLMFRNVVGKFLRFFRKTLAVAVQTMLIGPEKFIIIAVAFWPEDVQLQHYPVGCIVTEYRRWLICVVVS